MTSTTHNRPDTLEKALKINLSRLIYGTFAEIGAGQEIANWFFRAGAASGTMAKSMSAYDMTISDEIYGKANRYVSRQRMCAMLEHEYSMLVQRLSSKRGSSTCFFTLADTVRARAKSDTDQECHGWMGLRFQSEPGAPHSEIQLHVRLLDASHTRQCEAMGILGVNLLYAAFHLRDSPDELLSSLLDDLGRRRVEIDMIDFTGPAFGSLEYQDRLVALKLVRIGLSDVALFGANGEIWQASDVLWNRPVLLNRGTFDPVTKLNLEIIDGGQGAFQADFGDAVTHCVELVEITTHNLLASTFDVPDSDFLARADVLQGLGKNVLISRYPQFHLISSYLARHTRAPIAIVMGLPLFQELFNEKWCEDLDGGLLEALGRLFKHQVHVYVYPMGDPLTGSVKSVHHAEVSKEQRPLLDYLLATQRVRAIDNYREDYLFQTSADVRSMIQRGDPGWKDLVPEIVFNQGPWRNMAEAASRG
jgi:hypothetical protein